MKKTTTAKAPATPLTFDHEVDADNLAWARRREAYMTAQRFPDPEYDDGE